MMNFGYGGGILGLLILIGDIWALINIFQSSVSNGKKLVWILVVLLLPLLGLILWFFAGPRDGRS
jgi:Phospholipase_D-nuclease N-terminal